MTPILDKLLNARAKVLDSKVATLPKKETLGQMFGVNATKLTEQDYLDLIDDWYRFFASLKNMGNNITLGLQDAFNSIAQSPRRASQFFQIKSGDLEASDDPDDVSVPRSVLTTKSDTDYEFNWLQAGNGWNAVRPSRVIFGPGSGVCGHAVIVKHTDTNMDIVKLEADAAVAVMTSANVVRNYGMSGLKIQTGEWRVTDAGVWQFWPSSMVIDSWVLLEQELPMVDLP